MRVMLKRMSYVSSAIQRALIAGCAVIYTVLLVMSTACTFAHPEQVSNQHHHHGEDGSSNQNAFCAWNCQATADAAVAIEPPPTGTELLVGSADLAFSPFVSSTLLSSTQSRAPPSNFFVRLG